MTSPSGYFTGTPGVATPASLASMMETFCVLREGQRKADANMTAALRGVIDKSMSPRAWWAGFLGVSPEQLDAFLSDLVPLTGKFWDRLRDVFGPMRGREAEPMSMYDHGGEG